MAELEKLDMKSNIFSNKVRQQNQDWKKYRYTDYAYNISNKQDQVLKTNPNDRDSCYSRLQDDAKRRQEALKLAQIKK